MGQTVPSGAHQGQPGSNVAKRGQTCHLEQNRAKICQMGLIFANLSRIWQKWQDMGKTGQRGPNLAQWRQTGHIGDCVQGPIIRPHKS